MKHETSVKAGFTMIELIITLSILSFGIIGVYSVFSPVVTSTYGISHRLIASYLAQEGFEIVRNLRDNNFIANPSPPTWSDGLRFCQLGCQLDYKTGNPSVENPENALQSYTGNYLMINPDGFYSYDIGGQETIFKRKVTIDDSLGPDVLKILVSVAWSYNSQPYEFKTEGYLYNWK